MTFKDVFDLNPDMTIEHVEEWADNETNPAMERYLRECIDPTRRRRGNE